MIKLNKDKTGKLKRRALSVLLLAVATAANVECLTQVQDEHRRVNLQKEFFDPVDNGDGTQTVRFSVDTIKNIPNGKFFTLAGFIADNVDKHGQKGIRLYHYPNRKDSPDSHLLHEARHYFHFLQGIRRYNISPEQYAQIQIHDEISANIVQLLAARDAYLQSGRIKDIPKCYSFYIQALKNKQIVPSAQISPQEQKLIAEGMQNFWMEKFFGYYDQKCGQTMHWWIEQSLFKRTRHNEKEMQRRLEIIYGFDYHGQALQLEKYISAVEPGPTAKETIAQYRALSLREKYKLYKNYHRIPEESLRHNLPDQKIILPAYNRQR